MSGDLRIALIGQAAFGENVLNALAERSENVVGVFCPPGKDGARPDSLKTAAEGLGVPVYQFPRMRDAQAIDAVKALEADLGVMAFVTDIIPEEILGAPRDGTIQYHPSLLPMHRGPSSINWPIIQGETKTGLSIFWPDAGIDTGPILLQKEVEIGPDDTLGTVYFDKLFPLGVEAMLEAVEMVRSGNPAKVQQDESKMTYEGWCRADDVIISWTAPVDDVYNMIRGSDPSPGANSSFADERIKFFSASKVECDRKADPGEVVNVSAEGFDVAAPGGAVRIRRVQPDSAKKLPASEWAEAVSLSTGSRFGT